MAGASPSVSTSRLSAPGTRSISCPTSTAGPPRRMPLSPGVWNVWLRLAASGRRLGVWQASGRLDVWASGARLGARLVHLYAYQPG
eukprot:191519-Prymnesium_polylepis.1